ncbi:hypothetical protein ACQ4PT_027478 [Festuca glaucescens]
MAVADEAAAMMKTNLCTLDLVSFRQGSRKLADRGLVLSNADGEDDAYTILRVDGSVVTKNASDIGIFDRTLLYVGKIVEYVSDYGGQIGVITGVATTLGVVQLNDGLGATKAVSRVSAADLRRVRALSLGDYVVSGQWLGRVVEVSMDTEISFDDGAVCRVAEAASGKIKPAKTHAYLPQTNTALYPGARVVINQEDSSVVFMEERWLSGQWKPDRAEGTVTKVEMADVLVYWIASAEQAGMESAPPANQNPDRLTLLCSAPECTWCFADRCFLNADHTDEQLSSSSLPVTMAVSLTCTSVEVLWQDGTRQTMAHSAYVSPVEFASDLDFFPGQYVIDNSVADDDAIDAMAMGAASGSKRRVGVVRSLNSKEHMVKVSWFKAAETGPGGWEVECEDTVSAYELARDPDYSAFYGDVVVRLQSDVSESTPLAQKQAQALSWVGHVVDLHVDGHVQVKWGDGSTSTESEGAIRSGIDADLLQQMVQAVVAAVTATTRANEPPIVHVPAATVMQDTGVVDGQTVGAPVAVPNPTVQQQKETTQETLESNDIAAKDKEIEGQGAPKKKKEDKAGCFRCKKPGHYIDDCPTPFCDICESIHHATPACHLLNAPKPTATLHGYANEALMFFELSCGVFKAKAENPKLAKVTVDGAALTIPEIIEQLKKIVPSEKFNWEVFHLKENIFRVKLPSKLEVQRLKNFGTYICTDRDSCLTFDSWSSVEEPLYMLPEVWVRVSGLPSDIRTDYLALWGVGTLFRKTLDVDMAYTRKNKVLRTKIGCLNHKLIPADSDMFIRRGFYKLRFEVEIDDQSQEVNMVDANNGFDGHDGANQGGGKDGGGHDMDMDNKGNDTDAASKDNEQDVSSMHNGVDGMQEQCGKLDAVQIGTMQVKLVSPGNISDAKNLNKKEHVYTPISHVEFAALDDKIGSDYHADLLSSGSALGSGVVGPQEEGRQPAIGQVLPDAHLAQHAANGQLLHAGRP